MSTYFNLLKKGMEALKTCRIENFEMEAKLIFLHTFDISKTTLLTKLHEPCTNKNHISAFFRRIKSRCSHYPLQYILGTVQFNKTTYFIHKGVFIPRPETELLLQALLTYIEENNPEFKNTSHVFECGFGSGVLAIECARIFNKSTVIGWDKSKKAFRNAQHNKEHQAITNVHFKNDCFFKNINSIKTAPKNKTIIISNPPYIPKKDMETLDKNVRFEPRQALTDNQDGLSFYKRILKNLKGHNFLFGFELGIHQADLLIAFLKAGNILEYRIFKDWNSIKRILIIET